DLVIRLQHICRPYRDSLSIDVLIRQRPLLTDRSVAEFHNQVPAFVQHQLVGAIKANADSIRVAAGPDDEVVFESFIVSVVGQIDTGINAGVLHAPVVRDVSNPGALGSDQVIGNPRQWLARNGFSRRSEGVHENPSGGIAMPQEESGSSY